MKDAEGHTMHAKDVFGHCIKYMKNKLLEELKKNRQPDSRRKYHVGSHCTRNLE